MKKLFVYNFLTNCLNKIRIFKDFFLSYTQMHLPLSPSRVLILGVDTGLYLAILTELLLIFINLSKKINFKVERFESKCKGKDGSTLQNKLKLSITGSLFLGNSDDFYKKLSRSHLIDVDVNDETMTNHEPCNNHNQPNEIRILDLSGLGFFDHSAIETLIKICKNYKFNRLIANDGQVIGKILESCEAMSLLEIDQF